MVAEQHVARAAASQTSLQESNRNRNRNVNRNRNRNSNRNRRSDRKRNSNGNSKKGFIFTYVVSKTAAGKLSQTKATRNPYLADLKKYNKYMMHVYVMRILEIPLQ